MAEPSSEIYRQTTYTVSVHPQRERIRNIAYISVFGTMWGLSELVLGSLLNIIPVIPAPIRWVILVVISMMVSYTGSQFITRGFPILRIGFIAAIFKMFSFGGTNHLAVVFAIVIQSFLADLMLRLFGKNTIGYTFAGAALMAYMPLNSGVYAMILYGEAAFIEWGDTATDTIKMINGLFGTSLADFEDSGVVIWRIVLFLCGFYGLLGAFFGLLISQLVFRVRREVRVAE